MKLPRLHASTLDPIAHETLFIYVWISNIQPEKREPIFKTLNDLFYTRFEFTPSPWNFGPEDIEFYIYNTLPNIAPFFHIRDLVHQIDPTAKIKFCYNIDDDEVSDSELDSIELPDYLKEY